MKIIILAFIIFLNTTFIVAVDKRIDTFNWYNEDFIGRKFLPLASAPYGKSTENFKDCVFRASQYSMIAKSINVDCSEINSGEDKNCVAIIAVLKSDQAIAVSFSGSKNLIKSLDMIGQTYTKMANSVPAGKANSYFVDIIDKFEASGLFNDVVDIMDAYPLYELWVTGASLGGALASLGAGLLVKKYQVDDKNMKLVTFGQPRTGNTEWAKAMDQIIPFKYRIIQGMDIVPHIPLQSGLTKLRDQQHPLYDYLHFKGEIWYSDGTESRGKFKLCNGTNEDENCSNKNFNLVNLDGTMVEMIEKNCNIWNLKKVKEELVNSNDLDNIRENIDQLMEKLYKCVKENAGKGDFMKQIIAEHNTFFGKNLKDYATKGCPQFYELV